MPTISTYLKMMDQFSRPLQRVSNGVNTTIIGMERLKRLVESPSRLNIDTSNVQRQLAGIQRITQSACINITFNARDAIKKAQLLRNLIQRQFNGIQARIRVELPASLNVMFANLQRLVLRLTAATRRMSGASNNTAQLESALRRIAQLEQKILQLQNQINAKSRQAGQSTSSWLSNLRGIAATYLSIQGLSNATKVSDNYVNTLARLDLINDKTQTTAELQEKIFQAAERSRGSYQDLAGVIGKMGILASDAFSSNEELIAFSELMQKSFRVGNASTMEQQSGMYQLTQAMAAGKLQGDEFRAIIENAPLLAEAIAKFTGKSKGELKEMSAEGTITADIIKGAMFHAAEDINNKFATMPLTFGDVFNQIKNSALQSFGPIIQRINTMLNSEAGKRFVADIQTIISEVASAMDILLTKAVDIYSYISENWSYIAPTIWGIAVAVGAYTLATKGAAIAQGILNAVMNANPIILLITIILGLIVALYQLWKTNDEFAAQVMRTWNWLANAQDQVNIGFLKGWYAVVDGASWMYTKTVQIVEDMINAVIDDLNKFIDMLNNIPGVSIDAVGQVSFAAKTAAAEEAGKQARAAEIEAMEKTAAEKAAEREQNVIDMLNNRAAEREQEQAEKDASKASGATVFSPTGGTIDNIDKVGKVGKIEDKVDISSEDLKVMRELAEMKNIQNFVSLQPSINFGDTHVRQQSDINTIITHITTQLEKDIASSVDAAYG